MAKDNTVDLAIGFLVLGAGAYLIYKGYLGQAVDAILNLKLPDLTGLKFPVIGSRLPAASDNDNPAGGQPAPSTGTSLGGVSSNTQWYKANGPTASMPRVRCSNSKCGAGSGNSGGNRWENVMNGWMAKGLEVVAYFTIKSGSMCSGGHVGLKHGGPQHKSCPSSEIVKSGPCGSGPSCRAWWDTGIDNNAGKAYIEIENPHPHNCKRQYYAAVGTKLDSGKPIGVRWHISREGAGIRLMQWIDTSGTAGANQWKETYNVLDTGQFMPADYIKNISNQQNIEIRISDVACGDITMHSANSRQII